MATLEPFYFQDLTKSDLEGLLLKLSQEGEPLFQPRADEAKRKSQARYRAKQIFHWVYQRHVSEWEQMTDLAKPLRVWLASNLPIYKIEEQVFQQSEDGTAKFLWTLADRKTIESVVIPAALHEKDEIPEDEGKRFSGIETAAETKDAGLQAPAWKRLTACISSQVGCAMACKFCLTGIQGLDRSLATHEVVAQIQELRRRAPITNIVFMGMGEPLHNLENVIRACEIFLDPDGFGFSKRKVTVSTSGLVPAIRELGARVDVSLAISLNGSTDEQRTQIMPVNKAYPIAALMEACREYPLGAHRKITFEYVLLRGLNDSVADAARVAKLIAGIPSKVNVIPFNEHGGADYRRPDDATVKAFQQRLIDAGVVTTVRISRGRDILAACGQLRSLFGTARGTERHKDAPATPAQL